jgi:hypothetical protein
MYQVILFWNNTVHVSDGLSVHHQEFKTVHTATGTIVSNVPRLKPRTVSEVRSASVFRENGETGEFLLW